VGAELVEPLKRATEELRASMLSRPDDWASHYNLGNFHVERREYSRAIEAFDRAIRFQPRSMLPLVNVSLAYNALGQNDRAEASLRAALDLEPTNAVTHLNLGMLLAEAGRPPEAEAAFRAAFKYDPHSAPAAYNLGVLLSEKQPEEALTWCRRAADLRPGEAKYGYTLAFYLAQRGKRNEAIQTLEALLSRGVPHMESHALLGQLYERGRKPAEAARVYRRAALQEEFPVQVREQFEQRAKALTDR
jgi:tetratricopeptide (TPR) repeat protein